MFIIYQIKPVSLNKLSVIQLHGKRGTMDSLILYAICKQNANFSFPNENFG